MSSAEGASVAALRLLLALAYLAGSAGAGYVCLELVEHGLPYGWGLVLAVVLAGGWCGAVWIAAKGRET